MQEKQLRIQIIEDEMDAAVNRYGHLNDQGHDVYLLFDERMGQKKKCIDYLVEGGFKEDNIAFTSTPLNHRRRVKKEGTYQHEEPVEIQAPDADLIFSDGLRRNALYLLPHLPREKTYVYSAESEIRRGAERLGYGSISNKKELDYIVAKAASGD